MTVDRVDLEAETEDERLEAADARAGEDDQRRRVGCTDSRRPEDLPPVAGGSEAPREAGLPAPLPAAGKARRPKPRVRLYRTPIDWIALAEYPGEDFVSVRRPTPLEAVEAAVAALEKLP